MTQTQLQENRLDLETFRRALKIRPATRADLVFIAWCNYQASSPAPHFCYWDPLLKGLDTPTMTFIEAMLRADALAHGRVEDFCVVEFEGRLIAGASGFSMAPDNYRPLRLPHLPQLAELLGWTVEQQAQFVTRYQNVWADPRDPSLAPQAPWIIECVAVVSDQRGRGVVRVLLNAILDEGRRRGHSHAGISVTHGNEPARRVYEAVGFKLYLDYGSEYFDGYFPGTTKYRMQLKSRANAD